MSKKYNDGNWTDARFHSFIKSALRRASMRWPPKGKVLKEARTERGVYTCRGYNRSSHSVPNSIKVDGKRVQNVYVDHIVPVIGPEGFVSWDEVIKRMFINSEGLQVLCKGCHDKKTKEERQNGKGKRSSR